MTTGAAAAAAAVCLLALFGPCCQMAPAIAGAARGWTPGSVQVYELATTLLFREAGPAHPTADVGFKLTGRLEVAPVWRDPGYVNENVLLQFKLVKPQLWIKSRKAPEPEGFIQHTSQLDESATKSFYAFWRNGDVTKIFLDPNDSISMLNLKKGIISVFQYKTLDGEYEETDASGVCNVTYWSSSPDHLSMITQHKTKQFCTSTTVPQTVKHPNPTFGVNVVSKRHSVYKLANNLLPVQISDYEDHHMSLIARPEAGNIVISERTLTLTPETLTEQVLSENSMENVVKYLVQNLHCLESSFTLQMVSPSCPDSGCPTLEKVLEEYREALQTSALGSIKSATAFLKLIPLVRAASAEELAKILKSTKYNAIKFQLYDLLGASSTPQAHQAAMKVLRQDNLGDATERYLWALSLSPSPDPEIAKDILHRSEETMQNDKVSETMALTAAAMARQHGSPALIEKARVSLEIGLDSCTGEECQLKFLRALKNLRSKAATTTLLHYALNSPKATSIVAWRALAALPPHHLSKDVKTAAVKTFYQIDGGQRKDSTVRTIAADIILENDPTVQDLRDFYTYLASLDPMYEVRKYLTQRMEQLAGKDPVFAEKLREAVRLESKVVTNYNVVAQRGLSTAFTREYMKTRDSNGTLVTVQEVSAGLLKRGVVDVVLQTHKHEDVLFSLGLFAGGLGSFVSSSDQEEVAADENEVATAGMEIALLGVDVRPFTFFSGHGELTSHVWSGTASERTPAFQALASLQRHKEYFPMSSGFIAEMDVEGAMSFDLAGQIQLSIWSRNAESLVDMSAGIVVQGNTRVRTSFVQSNVEFAVTLEPKLELSTNVDFSGPVTLCMRLTQPETVVRHHIYKIERIPGSRHKLRKTKRSHWLSPARSYLLNRKNNEMCSKVFS